MKLVFVYNADSGFLNSLLDIGHKIIKPETYTCNLCSLTFGNFAENAKWKKFREGSAHEMEFLHRDEFEAKYVLQLPCPVILREAGDGKLEVAIAGERLNSFQSLDELITAVQALDA